jgi:formamidopyrimidine-DNA glycosylase
MDQRFVAGIGNIYSDEALFEARLRFDRPAGSLSGEEVARLHRAVRATLREAVRLRGSSLADGQYVDLFGAPGDYQSRHRVYGREGQPCPRCGGPVRRLSLGGRSTFFCETCQPGAP